MRLHTLLLPPILTLTTASPTIWNQLWCLQDGNPGAVYLCSGPDFSGQCEYRKPTNDDCFAPSIVPQSIGPDRGGCCLMYQDRECKGNLVVLDPQTVDGKVLGFT
ncbi:hypothetical protein E8E13_010041 [Curvularia kusanoi]|uniref:Uncharacterized protein n=1 Tax=Curvularia kusanoi TaxID=90978 RepID=A0A9P4TPR2_CURKU|nr:hypothetical protein E8E13_010041 [Curvularia kusanoi]